MALPYLRWQVTSGYYSNFLNPKLAQCASRFYTNFDAIYYCKPIGAGARSCTSRLSAHPPTMLHCSCSQVGAGCSASTQRSGSCFVNLARS